MDPFLVYLIAVNVVAFLLFTIDYLIMVDWQRCVGQVLRGRVPVR